MYFSVFYESCFPCFLILHQISQLHTVSQFFKNTFRIFIIYLRALSSYRVFRFTTLFVCGIRKRERERQLVYIFPEIPLWHIHIHGQFAVSGAACAHFFTFPRQQQTLPFSIFLLFFYPEFSDDKRQKTPTVPNQKPKPNRTKRSRKINNLNIN